MSEDNTRLPPDLVGDWMEILASEFAAMAQDREAWERHARLIAIWAEVMARWGGEAHEPGRDLAAGAAAAAAASDAGEPVPERIARRIARLEARIAELERAAGGNPRQRKARAGKPRSGGIGGAAA